MNLTEGTIGIVLFQWSYSLQDLQHWVSQNIASSDRNKEQPLGVYQISYIKVIIWVRDQPSLVLFTQAWTQYFYQGYSIQAEKWQIISMNPLEGR